MVVRFRPWRSVALCVALGAISLVTARSPFPANRILAIKPDGRGRAPLDLRGGGAFSRQFTGNGGDDDNDDDDDDDDDDEGDDSDDGESDDDARDDGTSSGLPGENLFSPDGEDWGQRAMVSIRDGWPEPKAC